MTLFQSFRNLMQKFMALCKIIIMLPVSFAFHGFKTTMELGRMRRDIQLAKTRLFFARGRIVTDHLLDTHDNQLMITLDGNHLVFKNTNTYFGGKGGEDIIFASDGFPRGMNLDDYQAKPEVISTEVIEEKKLLDRKAELKIKTIVYTPIDLHKKDTDDGRAWGVLTNKVWVTKKLNFLQPSTRYEIIMAVLFGSAATLFLIYCVNRLI